METGKVKTLVRDRKFGFIAREGKPDIFFHADSLKGVAYEDLKAEQDEPGAGSPVTFEEAPGKTDPSRIAAVNVSLAQ